MRLVHGAVAALLVATLAGCGGSDGDADDGQPPSDPTGSTSQTPSSDQSGQPEGGRVEATTALLDWSPVGDGTAEGLVHAGDEWTLTVDDPGTTATLTGPESIEIPAGKDRKIVDSFLTSSTAIVVAQDEAETRPQQVTLVDLASGKKSQLTDPPTGPGGPWAAHDDTIAYATQGGGGYCLATYDISTGVGEKGYCVEKRHGFTNLEVSPEGVSMMTFDAKRPVSCRTLVDVEGAETTPIEGVTECKGWEALATPTGHVWSEVSNEHRIELGTFHAEADGTTYDLGKGDTSTLTWCGDSAYFARAAGGQGKATLLRWTPEATLEVVYQSPGKGEAFVGQVSCSGSVLTVSAYGEGGDEVVSATVPG